MIVRSTADPRAFRDGARRLVAAHPVLHSVLATTLDHAIDRPEDHPGARWYWATRGDGRWLAVAMHTPPRPFHLVTSDAVLARAFAYRLREQRVGLDAVSGMRAGALAFAESWVDLGGAAAITVARREGLYDLPGLPTWQRRAEGALRTATADDVPLLDEWAAGYAADNRMALPEDHSMAGHVERGEMRVWQAPDGPAAMVAVSPPHAGVSRLSWVYTPPQRRGRGYGSVIVAAAAREQRRAGHRVLLYTDLDNQPTTALYERVGFRRIGDAAVLRLLDAEPVVSFGSSPLRKPRPGRPARTPMAPEKAARRRAIERMIARTRRDGLRLTRGSTRVDPPAEQDPR